MMTGTFARTITLVALCSIVAGAFFYVFGREVREKVVTDQVHAELNYMLHASWSEFNPNSSWWTDLEKEDDIYGALNINRIPREKEPDRSFWIEPAIAAMAAVGMMHGTQYLSSKGEDVAVYDKALDAFFLIWTSDRAQGQNQATSSADYGAFAERVDYDEFGTLVPTTTPLWNTSDTAHMLIANWKYYEHKVLTGADGEAKEWLRDAWPMQKRGADYLVRMYETTPAGAINLLPGNSFPDKFTAWVHFAAYAVPALRASALWAEKVGEPREKYDLLAQNLLTGIESMKDTGSVRGYFRYREYKEGSYGEPTYGESMDHLAFSPYETGAIPADDFTRQMSDWWTYGSEEFSMTPQINNPADWRYYGTRWNYFFEHRPDSEYLYPGPGFQLAKVEWKYAMRSGNDEYRLRSLRRLNWGTEPVYSSLWWYKTGEQDGDAENGFLDWRDGADYSKSAEKWARFVDTSAYFIEVLLMHEDDLDIDYNPLPRFH